MSWFKVDDGFATSKPVLRIPRRYRLAAVGLWTMAGTWSAKEETDGFIPDYVLEELCGTPAIAKHLVAAGLWEVTGESQEVSGKCRQSGWQFVNWAKYQPTKEQLEEKRENERIRKANYRLSQRDKSGTGPGRTEGHQQESDLPDPARPDPLTEANASVPRKRGSSNGTRIPEDFAITQEMRDWGSANCPDIDGRRETEKFIDYWTAKSGKDATKKDWPAAWRYWMRNAQDRTGGRQQPRATGSSKAMETLRLGQQMQEGGMFDGFEGHREIAG